MWARTSAWVVCSALLVAAAAVTSLTALAQTAQAAEPRGPAFGSSAFTTEIRDADGESDVDDYVASLVQGETLTVTVKSAKGSALLPALVVLGPDGIDRTPTLKVKAGGRKVGFKKLATDATGPWTVRVTGAEDSSGAYSVALKVGKAKPISLKKQILAGGAATHEFGCVEGALASIQVKFAKSGVPLGVAALQDPAGDDAVSGAVFASSLFVTKGTKLTLKKAPLGLGDGRYALRLVTGGGEASYSVKIAVTPQGRPKGKVRLPAVEPFLGARVDPLRGVAGRSIELTGHALGTPAVFPTVLFDGVPGKVLSVTADGTSMSVEPPVGPDGSTVSVSVVDGFGQASQRDSYFTYAPAPTLTRLLTATGATATGGPSAGGDAVRLIGTGFEQGQTLKLGGQTIVAPVLAGTTEWSFVTPAFPAGGTVFITLTDAFGRTVAAPFGFAYKLPPLLGGSAATTYTPVVGAAAGGTVVVVRGSRFDSQDRIEFDGTMIASTFVTAGVRSFVTPPREAGLYSLAIVDRYGVRAEGPSFRVKDQPSISSVTVLSGPQRGGAVGIGGGAVLRIEGAEFEDGDTVTLAEQDVVPTSQTPSRIELVLPPLPPGASDVVVTDVLGDTAVAQDAVRAAGLDDVTATRSPGANSTDDLGAVAAAVADLDRDGDEDDVVLVGKTGGSRTIRTRVLSGNASGALIDVTGTSLPSAGTDPLGVSFDGGALVIGDLDGINGPDIVVADTPLYSGTTYFYYDPVRVLLNDGSGGFAHSSTFTPPSSYYYYRPYLAAMDDYGNQGYIGTVFAPIGDAATTALAVGDLDGDGDDDVVATSGSGAIAYLYYDPAIIDFTRTPYYVHYVDLAGNYASYLYVLSATRILDNDSGLTDASIPRIGVPGNVNSTGPSYRGRDLAIGDVDGTNGPDIVVTWDDPFTASIYGAYTEEVYGSSYDSARVSTRLLLNDGDGAFVDATASWLPAGGGNEFWQGDAVALVNVVGSGLPDLLILHETGPSPTTSALRILRNDGAANGFTDVTTTVLPSVTAADNLGGTSLLVHDVDGDGRLDILVGTTRSLVDGQGARARSTRILFGTASGTFELGNDFLQPPTADSGETRVLLIGDLAGSSLPSIILSGASAPANGPPGEKLRVLDWDD